MINEFIEFNINDNVQVKLTGRGRDCLRKQWEALLMGSTLKYTPVDEDADGWSCWQLWDLMSQLGTFMTMGSAPVFETTIRINLSNEDEIGKLRKTASIVKLCGTYLQRGDIGLATSTMLALCRDSKRPIPKAGMQINWGDSKQTCYGVILQSPDGRFYVTVPGSDGNLRELPETWEINYD